MTIIQGIADATLDFVDLTCKRNGRTLTTAFLVIVTAEGSEDEPNASVSGTGYDDQTDLFIDLFAHAREVGRSLELDVQIHTLGEG